MYLTERKTRDSSVSCTCCDISGIKENKVNSKNYFLTIFQVLLRISKKKNSIILQTESLHHCLKVMFRLCVHPNFQLLKTPLGSMSFSFSGPISLFLEKAGSQTIHKLPKSKSHHPPKRNQNTSMKRQVSIMGKAVSLIDLLVKTDS